MTNRYPGNLSLPAEVKDRVLSTFRQTLALYRQGRNDEVIVGCELLLKMDATFDPARKLMEKAKNPAAPIDVDSLLPQVSLDDARAALAARDFAGALDVANTLLTTEPDNADALQIGEEARELMEAAPFVEQFLAKARTQMGSGDNAAAKATLEKARALDTNHPGIAALLNEINPPAAPGAFDFGGVEASHFEFGTSTPPPAPEAPASFDFGTPAAPATPSFDSSFAAPVTVEPEPEVESFEPSAPASSFVVESQPEPPAGGAPAADFGFTFEEEQKVEPAAASASPAEFSFDTPSPDIGATGFSFDAAPAAPTGGGFGEASTFDFSAAAVEVSTDDQDRIGKYLAEGDAAFETGDYANAIDIWSRIFLIDVTNERASERIEKARKLRADVDRKVEELMAAGNTAFQKKDMALARRKFEEVLQIDPRNDDAKAYLEKVAQGSDPRALDMAAAMSMPKQPSADLFDDFVPPPIDQEAATEISETPAAFGAPKAKAAGKAAAAPKSSRSMLPIAIAAAALIVLGVGGWFGYSKFFGGGYDADKTAATFTSAQALAKSGDFDQAIQLLSAITPDDPEHNRALSLIADFKNQKQKRGLFEGRPADDVFQERIANGKQAFESHDYSAAKDWFEKAMQVKQLPADVKPMLETASLQVAQLDNAKILFKEGNYLGAIANVDTLLQQNPDNKNALTIRADAHFNLGVQALQGERLRDAIAEFDQVLQLNPGDELAKRSRELAARYENQSIDLLFKIYAKHLPMRTHG